ncbi:pyridine nucleotide-disulfide oxidoreductase [Actinorhabdospora filicis]|uniref:Pyridine nucleotide-disulfide oxidoreductase n=1 Tax=Actinorhabdospora filicis TaxID=1785913 RepID=A0A9W6WCV3_9ACTN|nr:FAD/NAD(P)-binding protein [Actinorhabdospora filicis]GLZ81994.1 pyridine nucleotide-disulfide oxidoreductase [Actinorhabdospora filicis]
MRTFQVAVIGGGAAGVLTVTALLGTPVHEVALVDPEPGRGLAYGPAEPWHLLNSPARAMSAYQGDPAHFLEWCQATDPSAGPGDFMSRRTYGEYLAETLGVEETAALGRLTLVRDRAVRVLPHQDGGMVVHTRTGELRADHVVLAVGQGPARRLKLAEAVEGDPRYLADPWAPGGLDALPHRAPVLLLGTGLTAVDVLLSLTERGAEGPVTAVSRHGLLPREHSRGAAEAVGAVTAPEPSKSLAELTRRVRRLAASVSDWRAAVDLLRPRVDEYWRGLSDAGRDRFARHLARHWEVHRHRMAPSVAEKVARLREKDRFTVRSGGVDAIEPTPEGLAVTIGGRNEIYGAVVNCTGRDRLTRSDDPLMTGLLADGLALPGPGGHGLHVNPEGAVRDASGRPNPALWTVGPPRYGYLWETTAVPEIRLQASVLAERLATGAPLGV